MPLIDIEKVGKTKLAEPSLKHHLSKAEEVRGRLKFPEFARQFGIFDLGELTPNQLFSITVARNIAPAIDLLRIPAGKNRNADDAYGAYDQNRPKTSFGPALREYLSHAPSLDQEWDILTNPEDIPEAIPEDLLLRRLAPKEFTRRMTEGELLKSSWVNDDPDPLDKAEIDQNQLSIQQDVSAKAEDHRPYGYILLDASESMGSSRDRRDEIARGLALAFLLNQYESGNPCLVYLFRSDLSYPVGGESREQFERAAAVILRHDHTGMTNLQGTLGAMADQLLVERDRVDIALITDGITRLTDNPLGEAHLHTFLLGATPEELDKQGAAQYKESILKLDYWSDYLLKFSPDEMTWVSIPDQKDILSLLPLLHGFESEMTGSASAEKIAQIQRRLKNIDLMMNRYLTLSEPMIPKIEVLISRISELIAKFSTASPDQISIENAIQWTKVDRDLALALETRELKGVLTEKIDATGFNIYGQGQQFENLWVALWRMFKILLRIKSGTKV